MSKRKSKSKVAKTVEKVTDKLTGKAKVKQEMIEIKARLFDIQTAKTKLQDNWKQLIATEKVLMNEFNRRVDILEGKKPNVKKETKKEDPKGDKPKSNKA